MAASQHTWRIADGSFGDRWQTNARCTLSEPMSAFWTLPPEVLEHGHLPFKMPDSGVVWPILKRTVDRTQADEM